MVDYIYMLDGKKMLDTMRVVAVDMLWNWTFCKSKNKIRVI